MAWEDMKKKGLGWLKSSNNQNQINENDAERQEVITDDLEENQMSDDKKQDNSDSQRDSHFWSKNNQDKLVLDLIVSLENILKERELLNYKNKGLEDRLHTATETINRINYELTKKDQLLQESNKEIRKLENKLTNKQMSYDQLLEDYKEYQSASKLEYEQITNQLETEINKYNKLNEEFMSFQQQNVLRINELEEIIRSLKVENQQYAQQYRQILDEKSQLMQTINDFTARMSFSLSQKQTVYDSPDSK